MLLPPFIIAALAPQLGALRGAASVEGGMMNQATRAQFERQTVFVKWSQTAPSDLYAAEAQGLEALRATRTFVVPEVIAQTESFLALQWLESAPPQNHNWARGFAQKLVALHQTPTDDASFGWHADNYLGEFPQPNAPSHDWPRFYVEQRLMPQIERARENGVLPPQREALLRRVLARVPELCDDLEARPSLIHGDLWAGNFLTLPAGEIALVDPAIYRAPREMELAYIELFGGFPAELVPTYRELWPLPNGYERRRSLWQLYPLLVHLNAFGETYGAPLEAACLATFA